VQKSSKSIKIRWCDYRKQSAAFLWTTAVFTYKLHYVHGGLYTNCRRVTAAVQHVQRPAMNGCKCFIQRCPYSLQVYQTSGRRSRSRYDLATNEIGGETRAVAAAAAEATTAINGVDRSIGPLGTLAWLASCHVQLKIALTLLRWWSDVVRRPTDRPTGSRTCRCP